MIKQIQDLFAHGNLDEALIAIDQLSEPYILDGYILKSQIYQQKGEHNSALQFANHAFNLSQSNGTISQQIASLIALSYAFLRLDRFPEVNQCLNSARELLADIDISDYVEKRAHEATIKHIEGLSKRYQGDLQAALEFYNESLEIRLKLGIKQDIAKSYNNIGKIYQLQGELGKALEYNIESMELFVELGDDQLIAGALHNIAEIYWEQGNWELAKNYYEKSLSTMLSLQRGVQAAPTLFKLITLNLENEYEDQAKFYHTILEEIFTEYNDNRTIEAWLHLSEAYLLKSSSRIIKRAQAQKIFRAIIDDPPLDYEISKFALLNLCEMLLVELKISKNEEVIQDVEILTNRLLIMAKSQNSHLLLIETYLLQSKVALVQLDLDRAQKLLVDAEQIAKQKGLFKSAVKISAEHDRLINRLNKWDDIQDKTGSLLDRVSMFDLQETIENLLSRRNQQILENQEEKPIFLLILNEKSITLYSRTFEPSVKINEQLIGGFLMASDAGMKKVLNADASIERIKYGEYNLIFTKHQTITFCYAFEGQSYFAVQRLNAFIDRIQLGRSWLLLTSKVPRPKQIKSELDTKISDFFLSDPMISSDKFK